MRSWPAVAGWRGLASPRHLDGAMDYPQPVGFADREHQLCSMPGGRRQRNEHGLRRSGEDDDPAIIEPADRLRRRLAAEYRSAGSVVHVRVAGLGHSFAEEPGLEARLKTQAAAQADAAAGDWLARQLR